MNENPNEPRLSKRIELYNFMQKLGFNPKNEEDCVLFDIHMDEFAANRLNENIEEIVAKENKAHPQCPMSIDDLRSHK